MKKMVIVFAVLFVSAISMAQSDKHVKELGVVFNNLDTYGLTYRCGTETSLWRFNAVSIEGGSTKINQESSDVNTNNFGFGLSVGKEFRKYINKSFAFKYGADVSYTYYNAYTETFPTDTYTYDTTRKKITSMPGFNLVFGMSLKLHDFIFGAELKPGIQYNKVTEDNTSEALDPSHVETTDLTYGFKSSPVQLSVVYQF